jgi:hypothetical protein
MPCSFLLCGYLESEEVKYNPVEVIKRKEF